MIRNILFDMGNVLVLYSPETFLTRRGITAPQDRTMLLREIFHSADWVRLDRGTLTDEEALVRMLPRLPERLHSIARELVTDWDRDRLTIDGMEELVEELSAGGYNLCLLTNAALRHRDYWPRFSVSRFFGDRIMLSADWKFLKPEPAFYEQALEMFSLKREECIFIDDSAANVEGAERLGIRSIVFHGDVLRLRRELKEAGVCV